MRTSQIMKPHMYGSWFLAGWNVLHSISLYGLLERLFVFALVWICGLPGQLSIPEL